MIKILNKLSLTLLFVCIGCNFDARVLNAKPVAAELPPLSTFAPVRGKRLLRVITHFHTVYSFDACDGHGIAENGKPNLGCVQDLKNAVCANHLDYLFVSDHAYKMVLAPFQDLFLGFKANGIDGEIECENGHHGFLVPGLEGRLLGLGMESHTQGDQDFRWRLYGDDTLKTADALRNESHALVVVPHTESKSLELIERVKPDAIEIYNFHANFDPVIRYQYLHANPIKHLFSFVDYLLDSYHVLNPDYLFMEFLEFSPLYFDKWDQLIARGLHVTGLGGTDSHENVFPQKVIDGERLDSYRRMTRFMDHFVMVDAALTGHARDIATKDAIRKGDVYFVIEGLGTPIDFDFFASTQNSTIEFRLPKLWPKVTGYSASKPKIRAELIRVDEQGHESMVAFADAATTEKIVYKNPLPGAYRVVAKIVPSHLNKIVRKGNLTEREYIWMITNHLYITK